MREIFAYLFCAAAILLYLAAVILIVVFIYKILRDED